MRGRKITGLQWEGLEEEGGEREGGRCFLLPAAVLASVLVLSLGPGRARGAEGVEKQGRDMRVPGRRRRTRKAHHHNSHCVLSTHRMPGPVLDYASSHQMRTSA